MPSDDDTENDCAEDGKFKVEMCNGGMVKDNHRSNSKVINGLIHVDK